MSATPTMTNGACDLQAPKRNHYFHGKLLDVYHFELETAYLNFKRRMLNRLVTGYGVVCGLNVKAHPRCEDAITVCPGFAIDRAGNEIFVPEEVGPLRIEPHMLPAPPPSDGDENVHDREAHVHVVLCYHECLAEPMPVHAGDCCAEDPCQPGVIREQYKIEFRPGYLPAGCGLRIEDVIKECPPDYESLHAALARIVSDHCECCPEDACIPLANICVHMDDDQGRRCRCGHIDITVRPIVYNNDLLFQLLLSMLYEEERPYRQK